MGELRAKAERQLKELQRDQRLSGSFLSDRCTPSFMHFEEGRTESQATTAREPSPPLRPQGSSHQLHLRGHSQRVAHIIAFSKSPERYLHVASQLENPDKM